MENNNLNDILDIKESSSVQNENDKQSGNSLFYEKTLRIIANIILIAVLLLSVILFFNLGLDKLYNSIYFNMNGFLISIYTLCGSITTWAFFHVICNISVRINKLNK